MKTKVSLLIILITLPGCYLPVFDVQQSMASLTTSKMDKKAEFGPVELKESQGDSPLRTQFYPSKESNPNHGLVVIQWQSGTRYFGVSKMNGNTIVTNSNPQGPTSFLDQLAVPPSVGLSTTGDTSYFTILQPYTRDTNFSLALVFYTSSNTIYNTLGYDLGLNWKFGVGAPILPTSGTVNTSWDSYQGLFYYDTNKKWYWNSTNNIDLTSNFPYLSLGTSSYGISDEGVMAGVAAQGTNAAPILFFTQYLGTGNYQSFRWVIKNQPPELMGGIKGRIAASLTTGEILSEDDSWIHVYNSSGELKYSIPAGDLRFCYEWLNDSGTMEAVFSIMRYFGKSQKVSAEVFSIPSARLSDLAQ